MNNVVTINKHGSKFSILYGIHIRSQDPRELPKDVDAVVLETGTAKYLDDPLYAIESLRGHVQYQKLIRHLEKKRIPLIFADVKYKVNDIALLLLDNSLAGLEWMEGMKLLKRFNRHSGEHQRHQNQSDRKRFWTSQNDVSSLFVAGWLLLPFIANVFRLFSVFTKKGLKQSGALKKFSHKVHPEVDFLYLTIRNAVIAEKEAFLAKILGGKSHIATVLGAGHVGIEDMLEMQNEKRLADIKSLLPLLKRLTTAEYLYKAVQYVYNGRNWEVARTIEVPHIKALL